MKQLYKLFRAAALCLAVTLLVPSLLHAQKRTLTAHASTTIDNFIGGFYTSLPASYNSGSQSYPLLIFIHGIGEIGNGSAAALPAVLRNGPPMQINNQVNYGINANFPDPVTVNGKSFEFIVVSPQFNQWPSWADQVTALNDLINYCINNYRVDASKIYMTGLSMGGGITWDYAGSTSNNRIAGVVVVAGAASPSPGAVAQIIKYHVPVWATHNLNDPTVPESATVAWVNQINSGGANPQALETIFNASGHGGWGPTYGAPGIPGITNSAGQNIYQWLLQYKRSGDNVVIDNGSTTTQAPPTVSAGSNVTITLPTSSTTLTGSASTTGSIASYQWTQVSGPNTATFGNAKAASSSVSGLAQGTYVFKLTATDNVGQATSAQVTVTVNPAPVITFTVSAGSNVTITLPTNSVQLTGTATVQNTTLASTAWTQVSGPNTATITNGGTITPTISGVIAGSYVFKVTITSSTGTSTSSQMTVTVNPAPVTSVFTVSAGPNVVITLPTNSAQITGTATLQNETIASWAWKQVSGPSLATITNGSTSTATIGNAIGGTYVFQVTITSASGKTASAQMTLQVNLAPVFTVSAGSNVTITLPTNSVQLTGTATVQNTTLASTAWTQVSGPNTATITNGGTITPTISGVIAGSYVFKVTITSSTGTSTSSQMTLTVNPAPVTPIFTVSAGSNVTITLPTNSVQLTGVATVQNTTLSTCTWTQVSGPNTATITNGGTITPTISGVIAGSYVFKVTITSSTGTSTSSQMTLTVNPAPVTPIFTVSAGSNVTITLPTNSVQLTGVATVQNTTLSTCTWTQVSGPNTATITNGGTITPTISGVIAGSYVFKVTITSSTGTSTSSQMTLTVNPAPVTPVFTVSAGPDLSITLPVSSVQITGVATVEYDTVASCKWKEVSGPNTATIVNSGTIAPSVSNLIAGVYVFEVDMTSKSGKTVSDQMTLTVSAAAVTTIFTANAGPDVFITLPTNSWKIIGTCIVKGVTVATCRWKQVSGPGTATISGGGSISPLVSNLIAGTYIFEVDITSTTGLTATDQMMIKVGPAGTSYSGRTTTPNGPGIVDSTTAADLKLYPNPVTVGQQIVVEGKGVRTGTVKITIYELSGRQAKQQVVENTSENYFRQPISIDGLARGMYVLTLSSGNEKPRLFKFVVQ